MFYKFFVLLSSLYLYSCNEKLTSIKGSEHIGKEIKNDTLYFSYEYFKKENIFESFDVPIQINSINDSLDRSCLQKILEDKNHFDAPIQMSFYNEEYSNQTMMTIYNAGKIKTDNHIYYISFYLNFYYDCFQCVSFISLYEYDISTKKIVRIPIGYQSADTPFCFGDFNNDGKLDYLHWYFNDKVTFYTINNGKATLDKNHFLKIENISLGQYVIDRDNSNWFYDL